MPYFNLILGIILTVVFIWLLIKTSKRKGFVNAFVTVDIALGVIAGIYLISSSVYSLLIR